MAVRTSVAMRPPPVTSGVKRQLLMPIPSRLMVRSSTGPKSASGTARSTTEESNSSNSITKDPALSERVSTSVTTTPKTTAPGSTKPVTTRTISTKPVATKPVATKPVATKSNPYSLTATYRSSEHVEPIKPSKRYMSGLTTLDGRAHIHDFGVLLLYCQSLVDKRTHAEKVKAKELKAKERKQVEKEKKIQAGIVKAQELKAKELEQEKDKKIQDDKVKAKEVNAKENKPIEKKKENKERTADFQKAPKVFPETLGALARCSGVTAICIGGLASAIVVIDLTTEVHHRETETIITSSRWKQVGKLIEIGALAGVVIYFK